MTALGDDLSPWQCSPSRPASAIRFARRSAELLAREVHDPGIGFMTITRVKVTPDLQQARVYYTTLGDEKARARDAARALERATPFLRRQLGQRLRLRRVPSCSSSTTSRIERQDRIERILQELRTAASATRALGDDAARARR